jgi:MFS family permease
MTSAPTLVPVAPIPEAGESAPDRPAFPGWLWHPNLIVFVSSFCTMVLELVAGRIIAPYVGVSLYTWTSVIGVVLAGISLGNYVGGRLADRWASLRLLGLIFLLGGLASLGVLAVDNLGPQIPGTWPVTAQILVLTAALFFVPSTILGCASPIVAKLAVRDLARTGSTVGKIYAFSTVGSIVGTFATGFWLISAFGTHTIIWGVAAILFLMGLTFLALGRPFAMVAGLLIVALASAWVVPQGWLRGPCTRETNYFCIKVHDEQRDGRPVRVLVLDRLVHSYTSLDDPTQLVYGYEQIYAELARYRSEQLAQAARQAATPSLSGKSAARDASLSGDTSQGQAQRQPLRALFIGGGGYTFPKYLEALYPGSELQVVEIDPGVTQIAYDKLGLSRQTSIKTANQDARLFLERAPAQPYDLVLGDAFNDFSVPYHLTTAEFNAKVRSWLAPGGLYLVNLIDGPRHEFVRAYVNTLRQSFPYVYVAPAVRSWRESPRVTFVVAASDQPLDPAAIPALTPGAPSFFAAQVLDDPALQALLAEGPQVLLTDQYAPVDQMLAPVFRGESK